MKKLALGFLLMAIVPGVGFSQTLTVTKDNEGTVYVRGLAASAPAEFIFSDVETTRNIVANSCGAVIIRGSTTNPLSASIRVGSNTENISDLPLGLLPGCTGGTWTVTPAGNFRLPNGSVVILNQSPNTAIPVTFSGNRVRNATANACGQVRLRSSSSFTVGGTFTVGGASYTVSNLPTNLPPLCRQGITYLPEVAVAPGSGGL